jgi:hypothetical protein
MNRKRLCRGHWLEASKRRLEKPQIGSLTNEQLSASRGTSSNARFPARPSSATTPTSLGGKTVMGYHLTSTTCADAFPKRLTPVSELSESARRFYSPEMGRWVNRDPIGDEGWSVLPEGRDAYIRVYSTRSIGRTDLLMYAFAENQTINRIDPLGLCDDIIIFPGDWCLDPATGWLVPCSHESEPTQPPVCEDTCRDTDIKNQRNWHFNLYSVMPGAVVWIDPPTLYWQDAIRTCKSYGNDCPAGYLWMCKGFVGSSRGAGIRSEAHGACYKCEGSCPEHETCWRTLSVHTIGEELVQPPWGPTGIRKEFYWEECGCTD